MAHYSDSRPIDFPLENLSTEPRPNLPHNRFSVVIDKFVIKVSRFLSWVWVATLLVVLVNVFSRFFLRAGSIALEELSWHLFGVGMMLTMAYSVVTDEHVRVDVLFERFSLKAQCWTELVLMILFVFPVLFIISTDLCEYAYRSWEHGEGAPSPSGLPHRFIIKSVIPLGIIMLIVALFSRVTRLCTVLFDWPHRIDEAPKSSNPVSDTNTKL